VNQSSTTEIQGESQSGSRRFSLRQRILLTLISWAAVLLIRLIGPTLKIEIVKEENVAADGYRYIPTGIYCFWHRCVIPAAYHFRNMHIAIMISQSFDGEMISRIAAKLGFRPVRGSSSRGGTGALLGMREELEMGHPAVFTADGPRGPMYVAKPGPVLLAKRTGYPIVGFHIALERAWIVKSWDKMMIPKPFSRAVIYGGGPLSVPADATDEQMKTLHQQMQSMMERCVAGAEARLKEQNLTADDADKR
jgi:lysophospholipid acyltransferase (LPLAT)-like uncharacterized protein